MNIAALIQSEPVAAQGIIQTFLALLLGLDLVHLTDTQTGLILAFTAALFTFFTRKAVTANVSVAAQVQAAVEQATPAK